MNLSFRRLTTPTVLALALLTAPAWAQTSPTSGTAPPPGSGTQEQHTQKRADNVETRIADLHTKLQITDQQSKQWNAFAQTMRDNAQKARDAFRDRSQKLSTMSADDAMKSYADITQMHADNMKKLSSSFSDLYAVLSPQQKQLADAMYRNPGGAGPKHKTAKSSAPASSPSGG